MKNEKLKFYLVDKNYLLFLKKFDNRIMDNFAVKENKNKVDINIYNKLIKKIEELRKINTFINTKLLAKKDIYNTFDYSHSSYKSNLTNKFSIQC